MSEANFEKQQITEGLEQLDREYFELQEQAKQRLEEIKILEGILQTLEGHTEDVVLPKPKRDIQGTKEFMYEDDPLRSPKLRTVIIEMFDEFRKKHDVTVGYIRAGVLGAVSTNPMGIINDPVKFFGNLGLNMMAGAMVGSANEFLEWVAYKKTRLNEENYE